MSTQRIASTQSYDLFKAAVTFILLFAVLIAVALNSGSTQAAEPEPIPTLAPVVLPPTIGESAVVAGCIELSGTGTAGAETQIRSDDNILGSLTVGEDGTWSITTCVDPGNYQLVAVSVNSGGAEINRSAELVVLVPAPTAVPMPVPAETEAAAPEATESIEVSGDGQDYIVEQGDWLMGLAREIYGDASRAEDIFNATNAKAAQDSSYATIENPNELTLGWKIWIPLP